MKKKGVLLVENNPNFRRRIADYLSAKPDIDVIGEANGREEALAKAIQLLPDVILLDIKMQNAHEPDLLRQLRRQLPDTPVIVLGYLDLQEYRDAATLRGASAYVVKKAAVEQLVPAIRKAVTLVTTATQLSAAGE